MIGVRNAVFLFVNTFFIFFISIYLYLKGFSSGYLLIYSLILFSIIYSFYTLDWLLKLVPLFVLLYVPIGLLNISTWRGTIDAYTSYLYLVSILFLLIPLHIYKSLVRRDDALLSVRTIKSGWFLKIFIAHLFIVYLALSFVYVKYGSVIFNQDIRFGVPTGLSYTIKSTIPAVAFLPLFKFTKTKILTLLFLGVVPSIMIGARGVALVGLFSFFATALYCKSESFKVTKPRLFSAIFVCLFIIYSGFYLRRDGTGSLSTPDALINNYFFYDNMLIYLIMPFYLSLRETLGISAMIIQDGIENNVNVYALFYADLFTILPGEYLAAGQSLGQILGRVGSGGLTPGLLGGLYIDFGAWSVLFFVFFGLSLCFIHYFTVTKINFLPVYIVAVTQFFHLFHRGFLKPEYITTLIICMVYYYSIRRLKF